MDPTSLHRGSSAGASLAREKETGRMACPGQSEKRQSVRMLPQSFVRAAACCLRRRSCGVWSGTGASSKTASTPQRLPRSELPPRQNARPSQIPRPRGIRTSPQNRPDPHHPAPVTRPAWLHRLQRLHPFCFPPRKAGFFRILPNAAQKDPGA